MQSTTLLLSKLHPTATGTHTIQQRHKDSSLDPSHFILARILLFFFFFFFFFKHNFCVKPYVPREPRRDWRVIVGSMNMGYISDTASGSTDLGRCERMEERHRRGDHREASNAEEVLRVIADSGLELTTSF